MKPRKMLLCGKCFAALTPSLKLIFLENSMEKQPCEGCGKKY